MPKSSSVLNEDNLAKLEALNHPHVVELVEKYVTLCKPAKVSVITDDPKDIAYVRQRALDSREEAENGRAYYSL